MISIPYDAFKEMLKHKSKIKLSQKLRLGVAGPASQSTLYKIGGIFFLILSLFVLKNIYSTIKDVDLSSHNGVPQAIQPQVLGAYDNRSNLVSETNYIVQNGDTLFNLAQAKNLDWSVIAELNGLKAPYTLKPGTILKLPVQKN